MYPALAVADGLEELGVRRDEILWIATNSPMERRLVQAHDIRLETISAGPIAGISIGRRLVNIVKLGLGTVKAMRILHQFQPDVGLLTGGYVNLPVAVAGRLKKLPMAIYLPDLEPGLAIKQLTRFASVVACTSGNSRQYLPPEKVVETGYPVRTLLRNASQMTKEEALRSFELDGERKTVLIYGGSKGARSINTATIKVLTELLGEFQVIHVSGMHDWPQVRDHMGKMPWEELRYYRPYGYLDEKMGRALRAADLVVARAGASMLGEAPAFAVPTILVPYPHVWRYQKVNADYLVDRGAALRVNDEDLNSELLATVRQLLRDDERLSAMGKAAAALDKPGAARRIAEILAGLS